MGKCIIHKLKDIINNDSLPMYGGIIVRCTSTGKVAVSFNTNEAQTVFFKSPTGVVLSSYNVPASGSNVNVEQNCADYDYVDLVIPNKYAVTRFSCLVTSPAASDAKYDVITGTPNYMNNVAVYSAGYNWEEDVVMESLTNLNTGPGTFNIEDISVFGGCKSLIAFSNGSTSAGILKGDLQKLLEKMSNAGRESGTLTMTLNLAANRLYWGTTALESTRTLSVVFSSSGCVVSVTAGTMPFVTATYTKNTGVWSYT